MAPSRPISGKLRAAAGRALRSARVNVTPALEVAQLRLQVADLSNEIRALAMTSEEHQRREGDLIESAEILRLEVARLSESLAGAMHRIHVHESQISQLLRTVEQLGGSIQDEIALGRRLARIEDRVADHSEQGVGGS